MSDHDTSQSRLLRAISIGALLAVAPAHAFAHGSAGTDDKVHSPAGKSMQHTSVQEHAFGKASDPVAAARTIEVSMHDTMRFDPTMLEIARGTPLRFVVRNEGQLLHELVLGTREVLEQHAALMKKFPGMEHAEPYMAHVAPGERGEIGWTFTQPGEYFFACLVPGHFEAGMVGRIVVR